MAHIRTQLRNKVESVLRLATGKTIYKHRINPFQHADLPAINIITPLESVEHVTMKRFDRDCDLTVEVYEKAFEDVADLLDALCVTIENALRNDTTINAHGIFLNQTGIDIQEGDQPIGVATMNFTVKFLNVADPEQTV